jgi:CubicO group peptidase (beta-lactamase class C family)
MTKTSFIFCWVLAGAVSSQGQNLPATLDSLVNSYARNGSFNGAALVAFRGQVLLDKGYGWRNVANHLPNDSRTAFQIASITKQFTSALVLKLIEEKKMSLEDKLNGYYPGFPEGDKITIRNLLTHTSGITDYNDSLMRVPIIPHASNEQKFIAEVQLRKLAFEPGTKKQYSNAGYILLGYIIEQVTGISYYDALRKFIFKPLNMNNSGFDLSKWPTNDKATGYIVFTDSAKTVAPAIDPNGPFAAGAICSTVEDMYKWHLGLQSGRIINFASRQEAYTSFIDKYGFGWDIDTLSGRRVVSHSGGISGFNSYIARVPEDNLCIILLNNKPGHNLWTIIKAIYSILYKEKI